MPRASHEVNWKPNTTPLLVTLGFRPAAVLGWVKGLQPEPDLVYRVFSALCETRVLTKAGYARFRNFFLYGEHG